MGRSYQGCIGYCEDGRKWASLITFLRLQDYVIRTLFIHSYIPCLQYLSSRFLDTIIIILLSLQAYQNAFGR